MEESRRFVVHGFVQGVGYRAFVKQAAYRFRIKGTVQNLRDGGVEIYARAEPKALARFKEFLLSQSPGDVENIEEYPEGSENYGNGPDDWIGFNVLRDDYSSLEETMEYVVLGGVRLEKEMKTGFADLKYEMKTGFADLGERIDTVGNKIYTLSEKVDTGFSELGEKIENSSAESSVRLDTVSRNTGELNEKIDNLSQEFPVVVEKVDRFREDTIGAFGELDRKYHVISQNLERLNGNIEKMVDDLGILIREFVEEKRRNEGLK